MESTTSTDLQKTITTPAPKVIVQAFAYRDHHAAIIKQALASDPPDFGIVKEHEPLAQFYYDAGETIRRLATQNDLMTMALRNRVLIALEDAKAPAWVATHKHYKGTLYRVTGVRWDAEHDELTECVEYDDADGKKFVITKRKWESRLESGRPRYEFLFDTSTTRA